MPSQDNGPAVRHLWPTYRVFRIGATGVNLKGERDAWSFQWKMLRDEDDEEAKLEEWRAGVAGSLWEKCASDLEVQLREQPKRRTWALSWFGHWTFRCPEIASPEQAIQSFEDYVSEVALEFDQDGSTRDDPGYICLMGAEDRWRWHGEDQGDPAPCRCEHCEKHQVWRIGH